MSFLDDMEKKCAETEHWGHQGRKDVGLFSIEDIRMLITLARSAMGKR